MSPADRVAAAREGRCRTCRWWRQWSREPEDGEAGTCEAFGRDRFGFELHDRHTGEPREHDTPLTLPTFGCVNHEAEVPPEPAGERCPATFHGQQCEGAAGHDGHHQSNDPANPPVDGVTEGGGWFWAQEPAGERAER